MKKTGMLLVISGPSGSGKGTVVKQLDPNLGYALSISMTTREKRPGEVDKRDYFFTTKEEFQKIRQEDGFLEHAEFVGNMYGTPKSYVLEQIELGKNVILEIDVNGALQIKEIFENCILIFLVPPTFDELEKRLIGRNTEDTDTIKRRLIRAKNEIQLIDKYDYLVINDTVENAVNTINTIVTAESCKPVRCINEISQLKGE